MRDRVALFAGVLLEEDGGDNTKYSLEEVSYY